jgi:hypothetical protein
MENTREEVMARIDSTAAETIEENRRAVRDFAIANGLDALAASASAGGGSQESDVSEPVAELLDETPDAPDVPDDSGDVTTELRVPRPRKQPERVDAQDFDKALAHIPNNDQLSDWQRREIVRTAAAHFVETVKNGQIIQKGVDRVEACANRLVDGKGQSTTLCVRVVERIASGGVDGLAKSYLNDYEPKPTVDQPVVADEEAAQEPNGASEGDNEPQPQRENLPDQTATETPKAKNILPTLVTEEEAEQLTDPSRKLLQRTPDGKFSLGNREARLLLEQMFNREAMSRLGIISPIYYRVIANFILPIKDDLHLSAQAKKGDVGTALKQLHQSMRDDRNRTRLASVPRLPKKLLRDLVGFEDNNEAKPVERVHKGSGEKRVTIPAEYVKRLLAVALIEYSRP